MGWLRNCLVCNENQCFININDEGINIVSLDVGIKWQPVC